MLYRVRSNGFIEPCLPSTADKPPCGPDWVHEIKHDGYRLMARHDPVGVRLLTRNGHDWSARFPLIVEAVNALKVRSCLIDGEAVVCDDNGVAIFERLRQKRQGRYVFLCAFDLLELMATTCGANRLRFGNRRLTACYARAIRACSSINT
jgi:bifunctional non-homologous end joining protein LigD